MYITVSFDIVKLTYTLNFLSVGHATVSIK